MRWKSAGAMMCSPSRMTGFRRNGAIFASEPVYGIVPDMITCAKRLTSRYVPLGVVCRSLTATADGSRRRRGPAGFERR
ncbi:hypothetical protein DBIPINDM_002606 [Mesorhizobium sp. AR02]|uniref:hypothetical protein n=1 Tax=Mesorhizobium sp. AR02 TaxID=2865837 RepID=UPI00216063BD|nr:hypothetical protein [Mesorhizobium sp. AR02]UVK56031.1 hypothetical protein DBIPINDM_002606 [Mesorhizobium sp. AR02]